MGAFTDLDWNRIDVLAVVAFDGVATVDDRRRDECLDWLGRNGYEVESLDCSRGLVHAIPELGKLLDWEGQFGIALLADNRNLDALRDGFEFKVPEAGGKVLELVRADVVWQEDPRWLVGLISIAREASRRELALGRRFFSLVVLPEGSPLVGQTIDEVKVPGPYWNL